jgi:hypothetical protein
MYTLTSRLVSKAEIDEFAHTIHNGCRPLVEEADALTKKMERLQLTEKKFRQVGVPGEVQFSSLLRKIFRV